MQMQQGDIWCQKCPRREHAYSKVAASVVAVPPLAGDLTQLSLSFTAQGHTSGNLNHGKFVTSFAHVRQQTTCMGSKAVAALPAAAASWLLVQAGQEESAG